MDEKRRHSRQRTFKGGHINFETGAGVDCLIRNLSKKGACLEVDNSAISSDRFMLMIKPENLARNCQVIWRKPKKIGVEFV